METQSYRPITDLYQWPLAAAMLMTLIYIMYLDIRARLLKHRFDQPVTGETAR